MFIYDCTFDLLDDDVKQDYFNSWINIIKTIKNKSATIDIKSI